MTAIEYHLAGWELQDLERHVFVKYQNCGDIFDKSNLSRSCDITLGKVAYQKQQQIKNLCHKIVNTK